MGGLSWVHWLVVLIIVIAVFGTKKLRNVGSDLGAAVKGFKDGIKDGGQPAEETSSSTSATRVSQDSAKVDQSAIDVEAKQKH